MLFPDSTDTARAAAIVTAMPVLTPVAVFKVVYKTGKPDVNEIFCALGNHAGF